MSDTEQLSGSRGGQRAAQDAWLLDSLGLDLSAAGQGGAPASAPDKGATSTAGLAGPRSGQTVHAALDGPAQVTAASGSLQREGGQGADIARAGQPGLPLPGGAVLEKARRVWLAARGKVQQDIDAVMKALTDTFGSEDAEVQAIRQRVQPIMKELDDSLANKLAEMASAKDAGSGAKLLQEAQTIIERYIGYVDGEEMIAELDRNPLHAISIRKTLDAALAGLGKALKGPAGSLPQAMSAKGGAVAA